MVGHLNSDGVGHHADAGYGEHQRGRYRASILRPDCTSSLLTAYDQNPTLRVDANDRGRCTGQWDGGFPCVWRGRTGSRSDLSHAVRGLFRCGYSDTGILEVSYDPTTGDLTDTNNFLINQDTATSFGQAIDIAIDPVNRLLYYVDDDGLSGGAPMRSTWSATTTALRLRPRRILRRRHRRFCRILLSSRRTVRTARLKRLPSTTGGLPHRRRHRLFPDRNKLRRSECAVVHR